MKAGLRNTFTILAGTSLALGAIAFIGVNRAQGQQQGGQDGGLGGAQAGSGRGFVGGGAPGRTSAPPGYGYRVIQGKITAGDAAAGTLTIANPGGATQVVKLTAETTIEAQVNITEKDLVIGDEVQVQGIPTGISASSITVGAPPSFLGGRSRVPAAAAAAGGGGNPVVQGPPLANASANGRVVATDPLTISVGENMDIVLRLGHDAKLTKFETIPFGKLKVDDNILAAGTTGQDGTFTVSNIGVNITRGGPASFRPGGRARGAFPGAPGGN